MIIAIDFDGTCVTHCYPGVGRDIGAAPVLRRFVRKGHRLVLWSMRSGETLLEAIKWFNDNEIDLYGINEHPTQREWTSSPKAFAQVYIDDAALGAPLKLGEKGERPYIDWKKVSGMMDRRETLNA